jgi:hypothetical protein
MRQFESVTDPAHPERHIGLVLEELSNRCEPTRVLCCGHSLGGALATLGAMWASYEFPDADIRCITLGSPRVGSFNFSHAAKYLVGCTHRLVHGWDPVPTVPPPGVGFKHVKGRMFLHNNMCKLKKRPWCVLVSFPSSHKGTFNSFAMPERLTVALSNTEPIGSSSISRKHP